MTRSRTIDAGDATVETLDDGRVKVTVEFDEAIPVDTRTLKRFAITWQSEDALALGRALITAGNHAETPARQVVRRLIRRGRAR